MSSGDLTCHTCGVVVPFGYLHQCPSTLTWTHIPPPPPEPDALDRIADALERIAAALSKGETA